MGILSSRARDEDDDDALFGAFSSSLQHAEALRATHYTVRPAHADALRRVVRDRIGALGVFADAGATGAAARGVSCGGVRVVSLNGVPFDVPRAARLAAAMAHMHGRRAPATVVLAMVPRAKALVHRRPLTMNDINSGVAYPEDNMVVIWRLDGDVWKVLLHELTHLMAGEARFFLILSSFVNQSHTRTRTHHAGGRVANRVDRSAPVVCRAGQVKVGLPRAAGRAAARERGAGGAHAAGRPRRYQRRVLLSEGRVLAAGTAAG